ncbi:MAG TPA: hypothetical protein VGL51_20785, partial [Solirubrobacteraceae bacterium]
GPSEPVGPNAGDLVEVGVWLPEPPDGWLVEDIEADEDDELPPLTGVVGVVCGAEGVVACGVLTTTL